jgi:predicted TIM-barrel fold metal-dependent hydrolase
MAKRGFRIMDSDLHTMEPDAMNEFVALEGVSDKTKAKILWDNCARLYPLAAGW